jgi:hypothetical protein
MEDLQGQFTAIPSGALSCERLLAEVCGGAKAKLGSCIEFTRLMSILG